MRRLLTIIIGMAVLAGLARLLRRPASQPGPHQPQGDGGDGQPGSESGDPHRRPLYLRWLNLKFVVVLIVGGLGVVFAVNAWDRFELSTAPAPINQGPEGNIVLTAPAGVQSGTIQYLGDPFERTGKGYANRRFPSSQRSAGERSEIFINLTLNKARNTCVTMQAKFIPDPAPVNTLDTIGVDINTALKPSGLEKTSAAGFHAYDFLLCPGGEAGPGDGRPVKLRASIASRTLARPL